MPGKRQSASVTDLFYGAVTIGERGQVVIPAEARKQHGLRPGEKLLVFGHPHAPGITLARLEEVQSIIADLRRMHELISTVGGRAASGGRQGKSAKV